MSSPFDKYRSLVTKLLEGTKSGSRKWEVDVFRGDIYTTFGDYKVDINTSENAEGGPIIILRVKNNKGQIIDSFSDEDFSEEISAPSGYDSYWQAMKALYNMARRNALGADRALDDILKQLDDDLPF